ncbi:unnamed protein product [Ectocarpus sp. 4 AP-2014]
MATRKEEMINQRRRAALEAKMQKEEITRIMENTKRNQKKAAKLIQKAMNRGKSRTDAPRRRHRPAGNNNNNNDSSNNWSDENFEGGNDGRSSSANLPATAGAQSSGNDRTKSARAAIRARGEVDPANRVDLGPPPDAPTLEARLRAAAPSDPSPQPYMSPYENTATPQPSATVTF